MTVNDFLNMYNETYPNSKINRTRPRFVCKDGWNVSIQAGHGLYSIPRRRAWYYTNVELGYPSVAEELLRPYAENEGNLTGTVYVSVPVELVENVIMKHGGFDHCDFSNTKGENWNEY